jgi:hypothetical protein
MQTIKLLDASHAYSINKFMNKKHIKNKQQQNIRNSINNSKNTINRNNKYKCNIKPR